MKLFLSSLLFGSLGVYNVFGAASDCGESITVNYMGFTSTGLSCDYFGFPYCDTLATKYYFSGLDSNGWPTYTDPDSGAFFFTFDGYDDDRLLSTGFEYTDDAGTLWYFAPGWDHFSDVTLTNVGCPLSQFLVDAGALDGSTEIIYYVQAGGASAPPLYIRATLDDCDYIGFDNAVPTPSPTDKPTSGNNCPDYDDTIYNTCEGDAHCNDCQPWGCASCEQGYYKMGNLMRCQSCTDNYPNCAQCGDWSGCNTCDSGYLLQYSSSCGDEMCV